MSEVTIHRGRFIVWTTLALCFTIIQVAFLWKAFTPQEIAHQDTFLAYAISAGLGMAASSFYADCELSELNDRFINKLSEITVATMFLGAAPIGLIILTFWCFLGTSNIIMRALLSMVILIVTIVLSQLFHAVAHPYEYPPYSPEEE